MAAKRRILLVDFANSFFTHFHTKDSGKSFKFINNIRLLAEQFKVDKIVFCPEGGKSKYRLDILPNYKGARAARRLLDTPEEKARFKAFTQEEMPEVLDLAKMMGIVLVKLPEIEADDTLAYIANHVDVERYELLLLSTDYDLKMCLRPGVVVAGYNREMVAPMTGGQKIPPKVWMNTKNFIDQYEIEPAQYSHVLGIAGDSADSIPSPKGLGETSALKMIVKHGSIQGVQDNLATLKIPRLNSAVLEVMQSNPCMCWAHRNLMLTDLKHSPEVEIKIFGSEGINYLNNILSSLDDPGCPDKESFKEYLYENGKVSIVDKIDFWLAPFSR